MMIADPHQTSERLWRTVLHDVNNLLAGLQGVLDLSDPAQPLSPRNRLRLEATLHEGRNVVVMARALALERVPDTGSLPWPEWRQSLLQRLEPLSVLFSCPVEVACVAGEEASWPAPLLQDWAAAFSRQILPWVAPGTLRLEAEAGDGGFRLRWPSAPPLPPALRPDPPEDASLNLTSLWLRAMAVRLAVEVREEDGALVAWIPCAS